MLELKRLPDDLIFGFLVERGGKVQRHSAGFKQSGSGDAVLVELDRLFPGAAAELSHAMTGGMCLQRTEKWPAYCVVYAFLP